MTAKTIQLRRYVIADGQFDAYVQWWSGKILPLRRAAGFTVEAAFADAENRQIVWALSVPGGSDDFTRAEKSYFDSDSRRDAFVGNPEWVESSVVSFVTEPSEPAAENSGTR